MAMNTGSAAQINVTPLIDVLLVLLIIFMVITPLTPRGLQVQLPQPPPFDGTVARDPPSPLILSIDVAGAVLMNRERVSNADLPMRLRRALARRAEKTVFIQGGRKLEYAAVAGLIDTASGAGADRVALLTVSAVAR